MGGVPHKTNTQLSQLSPHDLDAYYRSLLHVVQIPYLMLASSVIIVAVLIAVTPYSEISEESERKYNLKKRWLFISLQRIKHYPHWRWSVLSMFCYCGAQAGIRGYMIRYALQAMPTISPASAANYLIASMICFFVGRVVGTALVRKYPADYILVIFSFLGVIMSGHLIKI